MPNLVTPKNINIYKQSRKKGDTIEQSLLNTKQYSPKTARHKNSSCKLAIVGEDLLNKEFKASDVTVDSVLANLDKLKALAIAKEDIATAVRVEELKGKYLAMFTDKTVNTSSPTLIQVNYGSKNNNTEERAISDEDKKA